MEVLMLFLMLYMLMSHQIVRIDIDHVYTSNGSCRQEVQYAFVQTPAGVVAVLSPDSLGKYEAEIQAVKLLPGCLE